MDLRPRVWLVSETPQAKRFVVSGMVQGVGYRFFVQRAAGRIGVRGYVKNRRDGGVEVYAVGTPGQLQALRAELQRGPHMAGVSGVEEQEAEFLPQYAVDFSIEHDW
jgi:acylphosphatase